MRNGRLMGLVLVGGSMAISAGVARAQTPEVCGNAVDDDGDGYADEGCNPWGATSVCEQPLSCEESGYVSPVMGALVWKDKPDFAPIMAYGPPLEFRRTYLSLYTPPDTYFPSNKSSYTHGMGYHWHHAYMSWVKKIPNGGSPDKAILHLPTGEDVLFTYASTTSGIDSYTPQIGRHYKSFQQDTGTGYWTLVFLTGEQYTYENTGLTNSWKLTKIKDTLATPNVVTLAYVSGGNSDGQLSTVTSANSQQSYEFTYSGSAPYLLTRVTHKWNGGSSSQYTDFAYSSNNLYTATRNGLSTETERYNTSSNLLTSVTAISNGTTIAAFQYDGNSRVITLDGREGSMAYDYSTTCDSTGHYVFFNRINATACTDANKVADCGASNFCSAPSGGGSGYCYAARRCFKLASATEDLIAEISSASCASCKNTKYYSWDLSSKMELKGTQSATGTKTSYLRDSNGMITTRVEGDSDYDASTEASGRPTYYAYGNSSFPGRVTEVRRQSGANPGNCSLSVTTACKQTIYTWNSDGLMSSVQEKGYTVVSGSTPSYDFHTDRTYDSKGRLTEIDGPRASTADNVLFTYWGTGNGNKSDYLKETNREITTTPTYLTTTNQDYNGDGRPTAVSDPNSRWICRTYSAQFPGQVTQRQVKTNGAANCTSDGTDEVTNYTWDDFGRMQKATRPKGDFMYYVYDTASRPSEIRECDAGSSSDCTSGNRYSMKYYYRPGQSAGVGWENLVTRVEWLDGSTVKRTQDYNFGTDRRLSTMPNPVGPSDDHAFYYFDDGLLSEATGGGIDPVISDTQVTVDALNRLTALKRLRDDASQDTWSVTSDTWWNTPSVVSDPSSRSSTVTFDDMGRKVKQVTPNSGTSYLAYDEAGNLTTWTQGDSTATSYTYDLQNRRLTVDTSDAACFTNGGAEYQYAYDALPGGVSCPSGSNCTLPLGRLVWKKVKLFCQDSQSDDTFDHQTFYGYAESGRLAEHTTQDDVSTPRKFRFTYTFDKNGNPTHIGYPVGSTSDAVYTYFGDGANNEATPNRIKTLARDSTTLVQNTSWLPLGGPPLAYEQANTYTHSGTAYPLVDTFTYNSAYRITSLKAETTYSTPDKITKIDYAEDNAGRYTKRDLTTLSNGEADMFFKYDAQNRLLCRSGSTLGSPATCPSSGSMAETVTYNANGDQGSLLLANARLSVQTYQNTYVSSSNKLDYQTYGAGPYTIDYDWTTRGNRTYDDDSHYASGSGDDKREYTYDGLNNLASVSNNLSGVSYTYTYAYDDARKLIFRGRVNNSNGVQDHFFYFYDQWDRLLYVREHYNTSGSGYWNYEYYWLGDRPVYQHETSSGGTTNRRFIHSDEQGRAYKASLWPTSGDASVSWALQMGAFGWDVASYSTGNYHIGFPGMICDRNTAAYNNPYEVRSYLCPATPEGRAYDPFTGTYLQEGSPGNGTGIASAYGRAGQNPVNPNPGAVAGGNPLHPQALDAALLPGTVLGPDLIGGSGGTALFDQGLECTEGAFTQMDTIAGSQLWADCDDGSEDHGWPKGDATDTSDWACCGECCASATSTDGYVVWVLAGICICH